MLPILLTFALFFISIPFLPIEATRIFYTISLVIKEFILWTLPPFVCINIAFLIKNTKAQAALLIVMIAGFEFLASTGALLYTYGFAQITLPTLTMTKGCGACLKPFFDLSFLRPSFWSCQNGLITGIGFGLMLAYIPLLDKILLKIKEKIDFIYGPILSKLIPLFILGYLSNSYHVGIFQNALSFGASMMYGLLCVCSFIFLVFFLSQGKFVFKALKNMLPAFGLSLTSASSLVTMPTTIICTSKNSKDPSFPKSIIPATTNTQLVGDCIFNAYLIFMLLKAFSFPDLSFLEWLHFTFWYVLAHFGTSALLGGVLFVVLPLYESILGFTPEMIAVVFAFNAIADPLITCGNVIINSGLCLFFEKIWCKVKK